MFQLLGANKIHRQRLKNKSFLKIKMVNSFDDQESKIRVICCDCIADMVTREREHATDRMIKI
jgi:hypothetical protein